MKARKNWPIIRPGNRKLGSDIWTWSIPAGHTCPGKTDACISVCYAKSGTFAYPSVSSAHKANLKASKSPAFARRMIQLLKEHDVKTLRIHVAGDFYSPEYTRKWREIVRRSPKVQFYAYTRSWRVPAILYELDKLAKLKNMEMWWSEDRDTGTAPAAHARVAYMAMPGEEHLAQDHHDLVFRVRRKGVIKKANGVQVCPVENGVKTQVKLSCTKCNICTKPPRLVELKSSQERRLTC